MISRHLGAKYSQQKHILKEKLLNISLYTESIPDRSSEYTLYKTCFLWGTVFTELLSQFDGNNVEILKFKRK